MANTIVTDLPVNTVAPKIAGRPLPGRTLTCAEGTWTNEPTGFAYQWRRAGRPLAKATSRAYRVLIGDEATSRASALTCEVTARNAAGATTAVSAGVLVALPGTLGCPRATGKLSRLSLGRLSLNMTQAKARKRYRRHAAKHLVDDFCLFGGWGIRAGYSSRRIVLAMTANPTYRIGRIRPGSSLAAAKRALKLQKPLKVGSDRWYVKPGARANTVLKVRGTVVTELGIANRRVSSKPAALRRLLRRLRGI
jgi:hypothetical protein